MATKEGRKERCNIATGVAKEYQDPFTQGMFTSLHDAQTRKPMLLQEMTVGPVIWYRDNNKQRESSYRGRFMGHLAVLVYHCNQDNMQPRVVCSTTLLAEPVIHQHIQKIQTKKEGITPHWDLTFVEVLDELLR